MPMNMLPSTGDAIAAQQAALASTQDPDALAANQQALQALYQKRQNLDLLNFAAGVSNNPALAQSVAALTAARQKENTPVQLGQTGFLDPTTGKFIESPMYSDEKEANRIAKTQSMLSTQQASNDRAQERAETMAQIAAGNQQTRVLAASIAASARQGAQGMQQQRMDMEQQRLNDLNDQRDNNAVQKVSANMVRNQIPAMYTGLQQIKDKFQPYVDAGNLNSVPGLTPTDQFLMQHAAGVGVSKEGKQNFATVQGFGNDMLKYFSGQGATLAAEHRQALERLQGGTFTSDDLLNAVNGITGPRVQSLISTQLSALNPRQQAKLADQNVSGIDFRQPIPQLNMPGKKPAATAVDPVAAALSKYQ